MELASTIAIRGRCGVRKGDNRGGESCGVELASTIVIRGRCGDGGLEAVERRGLRRVHYKVSKVCNVIVNILDK